LRTLPPVPSIGVPRQTMTRWVTTNGNLANSSNDTPAKRPVDHGDMDDTRRDTREAFLTLLDAGLLDDDVVRVGLLVRLHQDGHISDDKIAAPSGDEVQRQGYGTFPT